MANEELPRGKCGECFHFLDEHVLEGEARNGQVFNETARCRAGNCACTGKYVVAELGVEETVRAIDPISPSHYSQGMPEGVEVRDIIKAQGLWKAFCHGNVIKYVLRANHKNGIEDLKKARQYLDWLIEDRESNAG